MKLDKQTVTLIVALVSALGGGGAATKVASDVADLRVAVARIEARLDYRERVAAADPNP